MIGMIGYLGKVSSRIAIISATLYAFGATLGAAIIGLLLGMIGYGVRWTFDLGFEQSTTSVLLPVAIIALIGGLRDLGFFHLRLPQPRKQVPAGYMEVLGPYKTGLIWGLGVGLFFQTRIQYALYYVVTFWILLAGNPLWGSAVLGSYGLAQGVLLVIEISAISAGIAPSDGLFGKQRGVFFFSLVGTAMLTCSVYLFMLCAGRPMQPIRTPAHSLHSDQPGSR